MDRKPPAGQTTITINTTGYPAQQQPTYIPAQNYVPPPQYVTAHPAPPISNESWLERNQRNKPQSNSVGAATLVFVTGGMNIAWSFGYTYYPKGFNDLDMKTSWFIAAIIGVVFAAALSLKLGKKIFYLIASTLTVIGGILFTAVPNSYAAIMVARYLNGFANGFTFVPCLIMAGEEAVKETRGTIAATIESMSFGLGMYLQILFGVLWTVDIEDSFSVNQIHGILVIVYGVMSLLISAFLVIESPVYHLVNNQEQLAIDSLRRLQRPHVLNYETFMLLEEHKRYIAENKALSLQEAFIASLPAILKLCIYRGMLALTYSAIVNYAFALAVLIGNRGFVEWPFIISSSVRWLSTLIVAIFMETCGRKKSMITSMVVCATLSFAVAGIFENGWFDLADMQANMWLLIVFQVFAGSFGCASSAYLSEAFPLAIKPIGIASAFCTEMLVNIIILTTFPTGSLATFSTSNLPVFSSYFFAFGGLGLAYCVFSKICFPETMRTTLREAQAKFRPFVAKKE